MNYTSEQIAALADKGAEAAVMQMKKVGRKVYWNMAIDYSEGGSAFPADAPARIAYATAVLEGAEEMMTTHPSQEWFNENLDRIARRASEQYPTLKWEHMEEKEKKDWRGVVKEVESALGCCRLLAKAHDLSQEANEHQVKWMKQEAELTSLRNWKAQALAVEKEWDEQDLAKKLGGQLGQSCRAGVERLLKENEALKALREQPQNSREAFEKWYTGTYHKSDFGFIDTERYWQGWQAALTFTQREIEQAKDTAKTWIEAENATSNAYLRLRHKLKAFDTPTAPTAEQVWSHTEGKLDALIARAERAERNWRAAEAELKALREPKVIHEGGEVFEVVKPTPPEGYHLATDEERKCLPFKSKVWDDERLEWLRCASSEYSVEGSRLIYACPDSAPFRVTFTDGKINPPPFGEWHRQDWTPEMLPQGWRPLLLEEEEHDGSFDTREDQTGGWVAARLPYVKVLRNDGYFSRTRRPLPPPPAAPVEEWIELGPEDVPRGSEVRYEPAPWLSTQVTADTEGVRYFMSGAFHTLSFKQLFEGPYKILRPGQADWQPCKKLKEAKP